MPDDLEGVRLEDDQILSALVVQYQVGHDDPEKIFRGIADLIDTLRRLDRDLAESVATSIRLSYTLDEIEPGSIRAWIRTELEQTSDQDLRDLNWKRIVGRYLVKAKHLTLRWLSERDSVGDPQELLPLERNLLGLAEDTDVLRMPTYTGVPRTKLLQDIQDLSEGVRSLGEGDRVFYVDPEGEVEINRKFYLPPEKYEELVSIEVVPTEHDMTLLVKKPDYLGTAQWEFILGGHVMRAKILDEDWLSRFQRRAVDVRPGDSLRAEVRAEIRRTPAGEITSMRYFVTKVHDVVQGELEDSQLRLLGSSPGLDEGRVGTARRWRRSNDS